MRKINEADVVTRLPKRARLGLTQPSNQRPRMTFCLLSTMRNEAPFIHEWVAYHRAIGFEKIVVYSNDCTDGTDAILADLAAAGHIHHVDHTIPQGVSVAKAVAAHARAAGHFVDGDWVIWLDADEFVNIHLGQGHVEDLVSAIGDSDGICISWRLFGDSGNADAENGFISEDFTRCAAEGDGWANVKTLFRHSPDVLDYVQHKPILTPEFWDRGGHFLAGTGKPLSKDSALAALWKSGRHRGKIDQDDAGWDWAQINHYAVRTANHQQNKADRGRIGEVNSLANQRYTRKYFRQMNKNDAEDTSILRWQSQTRQMEETLKTNEQPAGPQSNSEKIYRDMHKSHHDEISARTYSNKALARAIIAQTDARTAIDVGCGIGLLMHALRDQNVDVTGVEGHWLGEDAMICPPEAYIKRDLEQPLTVGQRVDVAISIEVAEHLEKARAESFVADLCTLSDCVVFSAAIGGQGGRGHKNEQWQEFWCALFQANGYETYDVFRPDFLRDTSILPWFRQNVLLFLKTGHPLEKKHENRRIPPAAANMILPEYHRKILRRTRRALREKLARARSL